MQKAFQLDSAGVYTEPYPTLHAQWLVGEPVPTLVKVRQAEQKAAEGQKGLQKEVS